MILGIISTLAHASLFLEKDCFIQCRKYKQNNKQNSLRQKIKAFRDIGIKNQKEGK